jgi:predicted membrane-bound spermidine synthase
MKNWKTSLVGIIGIIFLVVGLSLVIAKVITFNDLVQSLALVATFLGALAAFFAKDHNVTGGTK